MKLLLSILALALLLAVWVWRVPPLSEAGKVENLPVTSAAVQSLHPGRFELKTNPEAIFQKALWRLPGPQDRVLNAERREWTADAAQGISHWQWFLAFEAGPDLLGYLKEKNAFGTLHAVRISIEEPPTWFPADLSLFDVQAASGLVLLFSRQKNLIYAAGAGKGFTAPLASFSPPPHSPSSSSPSGRLPATMPPVLKP